MMNFANQLISFLLVLQTEIPGDLKNETVHVLGFSKKVASFLWLVCSYQEHVHSRRSGIERGGELTRKTPVKYFD